MKVVRVHEYGGPEVMKLDELPTPQRSPASKHSAPALRFIRSLTWPDSQGPVRLCERSSTAAFMQARDPTPRKFRRSTRG